MKKLLPILLVVVFAMSCFTCIAGAEGEEFRFDENGKFTVLQISDPQDDRYPAHGMADFIKKAIEKTQPDFIVITGDIVEDSRAGDISDDEIFKEGVLVDGDYEKTLENVKIAVENIFAPIEEAGIYYAVTMGNNDYKAKISNEDWLKIFASYPHCITVDESDDAEGKIDQYLEIKKHDSEETGFGLWLLDNGKSFTAGQKEWFKNKETGNVSSIVFEHVPTDDIGNLFDFYGIVCNQAMTALHKVNGSFAFTNAAVTQKQNAFAVHLNQNAVAGNTVGKGNVKQRNQRRHEVRRILGAHQKRNFKLLSVFL